MSASATELDSSRLAYHPELDGLRGVAILLVLVFHSGCPWLPGGYVGVDLFFVLSGFLITALLLQEWRATGGIALQRFYMRRALRLMPALVFLVACYLAVWGSSPKNRMFHLSESFIVLTYVSNWTSALGMGRPVLLGHTWSLSTEEQFYLLWPPLLIALLRRFRPSRLLFILALVAAAVMIARPILVLLGTPPARIYCGLDTRADALLMGCLLGCAAGTTFLRARRTSILEMLWACLAWGSLAAIAANLSWNSPAMMNWGFSATTVLAGVILLHCLRQPNSPISQLLRTSVLVRTGQISYAIYLWHYPIVFVLGINDNRPWWVRLIFGGALTFAMATISHLLVEAPFLKLKEKWTRPRTSLAATPA